MLIRPFSLMCSLLLKDLSFYFYWLGAQNVYIATLGFLSSHLAPWFLTLPLHHRAPYAGFVPTYYLFQVFPISSASHFLSSLTLIMKIISYFMNVQIICIFFLSYILWLFFLYFFPVTYFRPLFLHLITK